MLSKILGLPTMKQPIAPIEQVNTRGAQGPEAAGKNPFLAGVTGGADPYGQYDRGLEHGFSGAQYRDGAVLGKRLNLEC